MESIVHAIVRYRPNHRSVDMLDECSSLSYLTNPLPGVFHFASCPELEVLS